MRRNELEEGINIFDAEGNCVGKSRNAAEKGITQVFHDIIEALSVGSNRLYLILGHASARADLTGTHYLFAYSPDGSSR